MLWSTVSIGLGLSLAGWPTPGSGSELGSKPGSRIEESDPSSGRQAWGWGQARIVPVIDGQAEWIWTPDRTGIDRQIMIITSLAEGNREVTVTLEVEPVEGVSATEDSGEIFSELSELPGKSIVTHLPSRIDIPESSPQPSRLPAAQRWFYLPSGVGDPSSPRNYRRVLARLVATSRHGQIYIDQQDLRLVSRNLVTEILSTLDEQIIPDFSSRWALAKDVDHDGRLTILLTGWLNRHSGGRCRLDGFVRAADFDLEVEAPFSNHCDLMVLNARLQPGAYLRTILAHEYAHTVHLRSKLATMQSGEGQLAEEPAWLDEAVAHVVEDLIGSTRANLDYRVATFLNQPESYGLRIADDSLTTLFRSPGHRGVAYLFFRWAVSRFGIDLLDEMILSPELGETKLVRATGLDMEELVRHWSVDLVRSRWLAGPKSDGSRSSRVDLSGRFGDRWLGGPRLHRLDTSAFAQEEVKLHGTSSHYRVLARNADQPARVRIQTQDSAPILVTLLPVEHSPTSLGLAIQSRYEADGAVAVSLEIVNDGPTPIQPTRLCWSPARPRERGPERVLDAKQLDRWWSEPLAPGQRISSPWLRLDGLLRDGTAWMFRLDGVSAGSSRGVPLSAWAEVSG